MKLYDHQVKGLELSNGLNRCAYYWDMGLGKSYAGSEKLAQLGAKVNLVVCQKSKIADWVDHFKDNYPKQFHVLDLTTDTGMVAFFEYQQLKAVSPIIGIINYDLMWRRPDLYKLHDFTLLLDESSLIQNERSKRSDFILGMDPMNVILLSGTPTGGKYENLWSQMHLLGWNISKEMYLKQYVEVEYLETLSGKSIPIVTGYKNVDRLKRKMAQYGCQFLKTDEVFDLPSQNFQKIYVPSSKEYRQFSKDKIITLEDKTMVGDTTLTNMLYKRMICGVFSDTKLQAFVDLLESTENRIVVFYNFKEELKKMMVVCGALNKPMSFVNGTEKNLDNYDFYEDSVTFVQYQSGAMGLNLQKASRMIFFTLPLSSELYEQSIKRIHRIGQNKPCFYYQLICKGTIEERILMTLAMRKNYTEELFRKDKEDGF